MAQSFLSQTFHALESLCVSQQPFPDTTVVDCFTTMKYAAGDLYHALRGKVVETTKQGEGWRQAEQFEAAQRAKMGEGNERRDRDANGKILSGAQQRNLKNSEGTVDWASKFSADERYSLVDFGVAKRHKRDEGVDIDKIAAAAKAFAAQKTAASADAGGSSSGVGAHEAGGGAPDSGSKRKRDGAPAADDDAAAKKTPLAPHAGFEPSTSGPPPPFALPPPETTLAKRIETVAGFVRKNGQKFEEVTRAKQRGNSEFAFLDPGGEGNEYYAWLRHAARAGIDPKKPPGVGENAAFDPVALAAAAKKIAEAAAAAAEQQTKRGGDAQEGAQQEGAHHEGAQQEGAKGRVGPWQAVKDSSGRTYYWNRDTQATTWTPPDGF